MVQIPDSARPTIDALVKYHFWILAALVPLLLLPALFSANGGLRTTISSQRGAIDGHVSALRNIQTEPDHPNDQWVEQIDKRTTAIRDEVLAEWQTFYRSQASLRTWPPQLDAVFLREMAEVESGQRQALILQNRLRYRDSVPDLVRMLPERMGCKELMSNRDGRAEALPGGRGPARIGPGSGEDDLDSPEASSRFEPLIWRSEDQRRLIESFTWTGEPSTTKIRLAQEELWVYGLLCDVIKKLNTGATGAFDTTITTIDELAVGYPAAEDTPGGQGGGRIYWKVDPTAAAGSGGEGSVDGMPAMEGAMGELDGGPGGMRLGSRPPNPRFSPSSGLESGEFAGPRGTGRPSAAAADSGLGTEEGGEVVITPDDALRQWIYVDFTGRPLTVTELASVPDAQMVNLVPFTLRVVIDQRKVDRLLQELATGDVPIDVRQVRINPSSQAVAAGGPLQGSGGFLPGSSEPGGGAFGAAEQRRRPFDVTLEVRGTVGLATPPNDAVFGVQPGTAEDGDAS